MPLDRIGVLRRQFDLTWSLAEHHLAGITTAMLLWEPAGPCWTVRPGTDGLWRPDWEVPEPDPVPPPTGAWVTWHLGWWWTTTVDHLRDRPIRAREEILWPGDARGTVTWLRDLRVAWLATLDELDDHALDTEAPWPWPEGTAHVVADTVAWANAELMKNVAELGQLAILYRASGP